MGSLIGCYLVYESVFRDTWVARKIVGETDKQFILESPNGERDQRKVKRSLGRVLLLEERERAELAARALTEQLREARENYEHRRKKILQRWEVD